MTTHINYKLSRAGIYAFLVLALIVSTQVLFSVAHADTEPTVQVNLQKKFSGPYPTGYTADMFSFTVSGTSFPQQTVALTEFTQDTANGSINLPVGVYTIKEVGPVGFIEGEWRPGWYGGTECLRGTNFETTLTVTTNSIERAVIDCGVDNQWRYGTLRVVKQFVGTPSAFENFDFKVTQGTVTKYDGPFDVDGDMEIVVGEGNYAVTETVHPGYTPSYSAGCSGTMGFEDSKTCTITNTFNDGDGGNETGTIVIEKQTIPNGNQTSFTFNPSWSTDDFVLSDNGRSTSTNLAAGTYNVVETLPTNWTQTSVVCSDGSPVTAISLQANEKVTCVFTNTLNDGGGNDTPTWLVYGYVWHDKNQSDIWEKEQPNPADDEVDLDGWTVQITNGSVTYSTTTDPTGYYYFYVPVGTWTIQEVVQSGWLKTFPNVNGHIVEVTGPITQAKKESMFAMILESIIPTAYAQVALTYGPFDFGNFFTGGGDNNGGGGNSSGGGGHHSSSHKKTTTPGPVPEVLGESTSVLPIGAPKTGAGGTQNQPYVPTLLAILPMRQRAVRKNR